MADASWDSSTATTMAGRQRPPSHSEISRELDGGHISEDDAARLHTLRDEWDRRQRTPAKKTTSSSSSRRRRRVPKVVRQEVVEPTRKLGRSSGGSVVKVLFGLSILIGVYHLLTFVDDDPESAGQLLGAPARAVTRLLDPTTPLIPYRTEAVS